MTLADEDASVVDGLGKSLLEHLGLKTALEELLGSKLKDEIELKLVLGEETVTAHPSEEGGSLEDSLRVLRVKRQQDTGSLSELSERILHSPDLALAPQAVFTDKLQFRIKTLLLVRTTGL